MYVKECKNNMVEQYVRTLKNFLIGLEIGRKAEKGTQGKRIMFLRFLG